MKNTSVSLRHCGSAQASLLTKEGWTALRRTRWFLAPLLTKEGWTAFRRTGWFLAPLLTKEGWTAFRRTGWFSPLRHLASLRLCVMLLLFTAGIAAQSIPAPKDTLGFTPGDDRKLASWAQVVDYFKKLDAASDRMVFEEIGKTTMGAPFVYATVSSPANIRALEYYRGINDKLADPRIIQKMRAKPDDVAKSLVKEGKTIVLITFGIHSTEVGSTLSSMLIAHRLTSSNEPEIKKILDNTIILLVPSLNPDGVDIVKNWYDKTLGTPYEGTTPPELYHKYVGHDNNRDWYAFTQVETQLTVDKIHNVWHPQIVHDVHQQGANGARLFLPPYMDPVEPNVPKQIVEGFTELGQWMANDLRKKGLQGITTGTTYDAWTPARAYSHYHGGVRILSETASARIASPITVKFEDLRGASGGLDAKKESDKFGPLWKGGEWKLRNITDYMTSAAFSLLTHAADNRERWLSRFYEIGKEAVRPRQRGELFAYIIPKPVESESDRLLPSMQLSVDMRRHALTSILRRAGIHIEYPEAFSIGNKEYRSGAAVIRMDQPYAAFAKAMFERQVYPNLLDNAGHPIAPYDVTAHTLPLLMNVEVEEVNQSFQYQLPKGGFGSGSGSGCGGSNPPRYAIYKSSIPSMDEGWTRFLFRNGGGYRIGCSPIIDNVSDSDLKSAVDRRLDGRLTHTIVFPDQSPNQILNGYAKGSMPDEYTGGVGKEGVENLKKFVEAGGTLVFLNESSRFAIEQFNLPVKDITRGLPRKEFYIPGSILRTELDTTHPIAKGMPQQSIAWFEDSPTFEIIDTGGNASVNERASGPGIEGTLPNGRVSARIVAAYPKDPKQILLSGWALGAERLAGKAALVEVSYGKGKIVLFGFRPQYRGQSLATFPLLFNAISQ
ncbi:MAG: M14 family zinc carboxypeptidase [Pyrinomonadaceae bacterium]